MAKQADDHVDHPLERLMFFSDAVFAIAITLLVIEIKVPHLQTGNPAEAWQSLWALFPSFFGYVLSFLVIGRFWIAHHTALQVMEHHSAKIVWPNIILLMTVAFMPFATANMAENLHNPAPTTFYNLALLALAGCSAWVVSVATSPANARKTFSELQRQTMRGRGHGVIFTVLVVLLASFYLPGGFSQILLAAMPLVQRILVKLYTRKLPG